MRRAGSSSPARRRGRGRRGRAGRSRPRSPARNPRGAAPPPWSPAAPVPRLFERGAGGAAGDDGEGRGPLNDLCVPSDVAPSYAPPGAALVSATILGIPPMDDDGVETAVREQLRGWFGAQVDGWRRLAVYRIPFALPAQPPEVLARPQRPVRLRDGLFVCGDHRDTASIQGAMVSGRRAAAAVRGSDSGPSCAC